MIKLTNSRCSVHEQVLTVHMSKSRGVAIAMTVVLCCVLAMTAGAAQTRKSASAPAQTTADRMLERGRYLTIIAGCNDCHTAGYAEAAGEVPETQWLTGSPLGWRGPWGTTYAINLRRHFDGISEQQWLNDARNMQTRPPMPWFTLRKMSNTDLRAIYRYIRRLGPAGQPAPAYLPRDHEPVPPFVQFPQTPKTKS